MWLWAPGAVGASCAWGAISDERLETLLRPGDGISTVITADAYGAGEADVLLGRALAAPRAGYALVGAVGHDFYDGEREGAKGYPRFTDPRLRGPEGYAGYLRMAARNAASSAAAAPTTSTCSCSTTPTGAASRRRRCGRGCALCATGA